MKFRRFVGGNIESNGYVLYQKSGGSCFIIDPGYNPDRFIKFMKEERLHIKGILLTHHHYDHTGAVDKIQEKYECPVYVHREDMDKCDCYVDSPLEDGDILDLDGEIITVMHTPGHTLGSVCFYSEKSKIVFTGDTIFDTDLGRTDFKDGDWNLMKRSCRNVIDSWSNEITIYPGHDQSCNMKFVRKFNLEFIDAIK